MTTVRNVACVFLMAAGLVSAQPMLDLQESPPASGLLTARLTSSYAATGFGSAKIWTFNAEANDRVTFLVRTDASTGANPIIRLIAPSGSTVSQLAGSYDGFASLENVSLPTPGVYQVAVYSDSKVSAFSLSVLLGRGVELESESNDLRTLADEPRFFPQGGGFKGVIAGVLDRDADWDDLGMLSAGQSVNLSLQPPSGSSLSASGVELALFKDADTSPVLTSTGGSLVHTVASAGNYRVRVRVPDLDGRNLHFEGSQSVSLGNPEALRITGSQTVEFWIKPDDFNTRQNPYAKAYAGEGTMTIETDGTVNYFYGTGGGNNAPYQTFNTGTPLRAGRWQHLALVRDFSSTPKQLRWYLDGKLVAQAEASYFPAVASSLDATIGTGYAGNLRGSMDEVRIWNSPRSASEILDNLDNSLAGTESGLAAYYKFSEGSGTSTADASTSAITGTISGVPTWEGFTSANLTNFVAQGQNSSYFLSASISDTSVPSVTSVDLAPNRGHLIDGTSFAPYNMSALAANVGQSYLYTLQGDTSGSIAGTDSYTVDSYLGKAAVHAGVLLPSEIGAVRVTIQPGLPSYYSSFRNGVSSSLGVGTSASYRIERYVPAVPFTLDAIYTSVTVSFDEEMDETTLASGVTLSAAGPDGNFGTADDISYPLVFSSFTGNRRAIFQLGGGRILLPGAHRLTVPATVTDRAGNPLASAYVKNFTVLGVDAYVNEDGDNGSIATADTISTGVQAGQADGSFLDLGRTTATGGWPFDIETADFDGDGKTDAAVTHLGSLDALRIYPGDGARGFGASINFDGIGDEPYDVQLIDWDKDGDLDLAVTLAGPDKVGFFRNDSTPGNIVFTRQADVTVGDWPRRLALGDFNADGYPDLVVSNNGANATTGYSVSVLLNDKAGSFTESKLGLTLSPKLRPWGIAAGDFNKDGKADIAVADTDNGDRLAVFLGVGDGTFGAPTFLDMPDGPDVTDLKTADFNKDGNPDLVAVATGNSLYTYWIFPGNGDGTFGTRADFPLGYGYYNELVKVADVNGDSWPDLLLGGNDHVTVASNRADGTLGFGTVRRNWYETYGVAAADLNGDGRAELIVADHDNYLLRVLDGNARSPLAADDTAQGMRHGFGRGFLSDDSDLDFWSFSASRGQVLTVAVDHSTVADNAGLYWEIYDETGAYLTGFTNTNSSWRGESPPVVIPRDGTYYVRVSPYYSYRGEYRFRASLAPSGTQVERENNNQISQANGVTFTLSGNSLGATVGGYMAGYDTSGDFYGLGNLASGTQVDVTVRIPSTSGLVPTLALFKSDGTQVTPDELTPTRLVYTLQVGDESTYYVRVGGSAGLGLMAEYFADISIADTVPPTITASSLPNPSSDGMVTSFSLSFNKDMLASTVNTTSNYTLVWAGPDGSFSTADDAVIPVIPANYTSGLSNNYTISNGPLRPGNYVFTATTGLRDKTGNNLPLPFQRAFSITGPAGFATETEPNNSGATASQLVFDTSIPGYLTANARGVLSSSEDVEYWTFPAQSGDVMAFEVFMQYEPDSYLLNWYLTDPDGQVVFERNLGNNSLETNNPITLSKTGDYRLRIDDYHGIRTEHRFRVSLMRGLQSESEQNDSLGTADPVTFTQVGGISTASVAGFISTNAELDYFDLGQISSGNTVFLSARQPAGSTLGPIVALYSQAGTLMAETNGVAGDGAAEIQIPSNGRYYALIRGSLGTTGLNGDYILDARVLPTSAINFPNLRVTRLDEITTPGLKTGDNINLSYTVTNVGNLATSASIWVDRVVISQNPVYGDADDIQLALITHNGSLAAGADYTVNQSLALKDGLPGSYYLLVKTDSSNSVDEILQEGDNVTATTNPFNVILKDYPDLLPENLVISEPDGDGNRTISWNLSNKGTGTAAAGHTTRLQVLNTTTSQLVQDVTIPVASPLAAAASVAQSREITTVTPGFYLVTVSADSGDLLYEFGTGGHATAEQNAVQGNFRIYRLYNVAVSASPAAGGSVSGGGALREGIPATVTATANTSVLPYTFLNWTEDGAFASGQANYTFVPTRDRNLVAVFGLPQFQIAVTVAVPGTGSVSGTGNFSINTPVSLTPNPAAGYLFDHWEEGGSSIGNTTPLAFNATANRNIIAFFREAVPSHVVATATQPANLAVIPGAGTYTNGQTLTITAPARVEKDGSEFLFQRIELNGQFLGTSPTFTKTVTTLDAASLQYTAIYLERSLKPKVTGVASSSGTLIPIASGVTFTATFDRDMSTSVVPVFALQSGNATAVPSVPAGGTWTDARHFRSSGVSFGATNGGAYTLRITGASDGEGRVMDPDESFGFNMDALVPANPVPTITASGPTSATFGWGSYAAPADLSGFRYYIEETNFTSVTGLSAKGGGNAAARSNVFQSLVPDREYFAAVTAVDVAGNSNPAVTPVRIFLQSQVPPPATPVLTSTGLDSVRLDWSTYDTSAIVGLSRFKIFVQTSPFTTVDGLTPAGDVAAATKVFDIGSLNRTQTYYIAVVAYNGFGQFNPAVTPLTWTDPLAGTLRTNLSVGGPTAVIPIHADLVLQDGAVLTIAPGTTLRFAAGAGIEVLNGKIIANGTDLLPIHFTSDAEGASPTRGAWDGITLSSPSGVSELSRVWVRYGGGLRITKGSPLVSNIYAVQNSGAGISVSNDAQIDAASCYLAFNENGLTASGSSNVRIRQSVILTNTTSNATQSGTAVLDAASNWWGSSSASTISASLVGTVSSGTPLTGEPVIGSALASASGVTDTGSRDVELRLMAVNAVKYRMSENAAFPGVAFTDLFSSDESFRIRPYGFVLPYRLSAGAGLKSVYLQTNSGTSTAGGTLSVGFNYITGGPSVTAFSLVEGQVVSRPLAVTGAATAPLGVKWIDLLVDGVAVARSSAATFNTQWDPRTLSSGIHRVELRARDQAGNESGRALNVVANPGPPPAPVITLPLNASVTNVGTTTVTGTAEPGIPLRVTRNGATVSGSVNAAPDGSFSVSGVSLVEGSNKIVVDAFDSLGSASSAPVTVVFDSGPPTAPVLLEPAYQAGSGLRLEWQYAITGERPTKFRAFWKNAPFTQTSEASGQSALLEGQTSTVLSSLPDGMWYFSIVGYDDAGNASVLSNQRAISLDFSKPTLTVAYDGALPAGPGNLVITVTSSEALVATPVFSIRPAGGDVVSVTLIRQSPTQFTANFAVTDLSAKSGTATVTASATDLAGNNFTGSPTGPALAFDVTKPTATLSYDRAAPIRTQNDITVQLGLQLSELPAVGSTPTLKFEPPVGADVPITLTGSGLSWTGSLPMTAAMGRGIGFFRLSVTDRSGNVGTVVTPSSLEIYNTALPDPPARPTGLSAQTLAAGRILINWDDVPRAESYKIYREPGNNATVPAILIADNLTTSDFTDTPPADGIYTYAIVATLRGADGPASGVLNALSDRTPPSVPLNFAATLGGTGVSISWSAPSGETPYSYHVYRGETSIFTSPTPVTINDNPPRGIHEYRVASVDSHGNENFATPITIELLVSPVKNMQVLVRDDSATSISWQSDDSTVTGYNVYRNGTKQNGAPLTNTFFVDQLPLGTTSVTYEVTARNAAGNESPRRSLTAIAANINLLLNPDANGVERDSAQFYFDSLRPVVTNVASTGTLRIERFDIIRTAGATDSLDTGTAASITLNPGETGNMDWIVPAPRVQGVPQTIQLIARGPADPSGGRVSYEKSFTKRSAVRSPNIATLQPVSPPLAGGLTDFVATIFNPSSVPIEIIIGRGFGNEAGDVSVRVLDPSGVEVYRKPFKGTGVSPVTVDGSGTAYITIPPSGSRSFTIPEIFVPESLGRAGLSATFILDIAAIRYRLGTGGLTGAGAIGGQTVSSLVETPYYGTAATSKTSYANNEPVHITGQAIDRTTLQPLANKPLRLGFGARGFVTWQDVTTDGSGNYQFDYTPVLGFAGRLNIWAAHPDVVDQLNQVTIEYRRLYVTPGRGDIVMSKNDTLDITLNTVNPGDLPASQVDVTARVFVMDGSNEVEITSIRAALLGSPFNILPNEQRSAAVRLTADLDAPDNALVDLTFLSSDGASATFRGSLSLRPAVPALSFSSPKVGYVEGSVNRGSIRSYQVTLQNLGLRPVENPEMFLPDNLNWVDVNLPRTADGRIQLQDIPVGGSVTFGVSFAPSESVPLGLYNGFFEVRASNLLSPFRINVFPQVTSSLVGDVKFAVDNIFVDPVPNAKIRMRNPNLREELGPFLTDANGEVTVPNLQEGTWSWQVTAAGHSTQTGTIDVVPGQVNLVQTRLSKSLVTVEFSVVPKPFTDRYEILIEQTFETRVPFPVLVFDPPSFKFTNIPDQYETTLLVKVRNEGLISMFDVQLQGETSSYASLQPLVNYMPELRAQEEVLVPFRLLWNRHGLGSEGTGAVTSSDLGGSISGCADASFKPNILDDDFMAGINAIGKAIAQCADGMTAALVCSLIVTIDTVDFIMGFVGLEAIAETLGKFLGCVFANYFKDFGIPSGGGGPGNGNGGGFEGRGCFPAGTPVTLSDGTRVPIEQVKKGQKVRSSVWQGHYGEAEDLIIRESETLRELTFREVRAGREPLDDSDLKLKITGEHLVWADVNGWTAASELKPGDWVHHESGALLEVAANDPIPGRHKVYTLEVNSANAFFASGVMVQDLCGLQKTGDKSVFSTPAITTEPLR